GAATAPTTGAGAWLAAGAIRCVCLFGGRSPLPLGVRRGLLPAAGAGALPAAVARRALAARGGRGGVLTLLRLGLGGDDPAQGVGRDAEVVVEVLGGGVGLLRLVERQVQRLVDHLPAV